MSSVQKRCAACGSERIIQGAPVKNGVQTVVDDEIGTHGEPLVVISTNPTSDASAQRYVLSRVHAWVCGDCGYMPLFADDPQLLYAAYQEFLRAMRG